MQNRPVPHFVAEGRLVVRRLLLSPTWRLRELLLTPAAERALRDVLSGIDPARRPAIQILSKAELSQIGGVKFHQGCLGFAERPDTPHWSALGLGCLGDGPAPVENSRGPSPTDPSPIIVLESVRDPDNVGSIFRAALAFGASAVLLGPGCADPLYRKTVRTSMGAVLSLPFGDATPWPATLLELRASGYTIVATTPDPSAEALPDAALSLGAARVALLVGSEGAGLSSAALAAADRRVRIPIAAGVDSLNVATATAIALYALRGRACFPQF